MHLAPREIEKLMLHNAGFLAQQRLARGVRLNYPESIALISTQLLEFIRDGKSVAERMDLGRQFLGRRQVQDGVAGMIAEVQVEGTFPDGTKLVTVHHPVVEDNGNLELALYGSFLDIPDLEVFGSVDEDAQLPGTCQAAEGELELHEGREGVRIEVTNLGDRPVQVGSHYHFVETNKGLSFDRSAAYGMRLDIPAGTAVRFEPGDTKTVALVAIGGNKVIRGGNNLADGAVSDEGRDAALGQISDRGFSSQEG